MPENVIVDPKEWADADKGLKELAAARGGIKPPEVSNQLITEAERAAGAQEMNRLKQKSLKETGSFSPEQVAAARREAGLPEPSAEKEKVIGPEQWDRVGKKLLEEELRKWRTDQKFAISVLREMQQPEGAMTSYGQEIHKEQIDPKKIAAQEQKVLDLNRKIQEVQKLIAAAKEKR